MNWQSEDVDDQLVGRLMESQSRSVYNSVTVAEWELNCQNNNKRIGMTLSSPSLLLADTLPTIQQQQKDKIMLLTATWRRAQMY